MARRPKSQRKCRDCPTVFVGTTAVYCRPCRRRYTPNPPAAKRLYVWTPEKDEVLRRLYDGRRGCVKKIAAAVGFNYKAVSVRAAQLGVSHRPDWRAWTAAELQLLEEHAGH